MQRSTAAAQSSSYCGGNGFDRGSLCWRVLRWSLLGAPFGSQSTHVPQPSPLGADLAKYAAARTRGPKPARRRRNRLFRPPIGLPTGRSVGGYIITGCTHTGSRPSRRSAESSARNGRIGRAQHGGAADVDKGGRLRRLFNSTEHQHHPHGVEKRRKTYHPVANEQKCPCHCERCRAKAPRTTYATKSGESRSSPPVGGPFAHQNFSGSGRTDDSRIHSAASAS